MIFKHFILPVKIKWIMKSGLGFYMTGGWKIRRLEKENTLTGEARCIILMKDYRLYFPLLFFEIVH